MRPWLLRALVLAVAYGLGQAGFVALRAALPDAVTWWSALLIGVLVLAGVLWAGAEVVLDRRPPEWTWFRAALATGPAAGVLSWALVALAVDASGAEDLGAALLGRAAFTAVLVLVSAAVGSALGRVATDRVGGSPVAGRDPC